MEVYCECNSECNLSIEVPEEEYKQFIRNGNVIIVNGCAKGPEPGDTLIEEREGYSVYRDSLL